MSSTAPEATAAWWPNTTNPFDAALGYHTAGLCVIPLNGKRPALGSWKHYQKQRPPEAAIRRWQQEGLLRNVGIVCGAVSNNLVVLDFDGPAAYAAFAALFLTLAQSFTVATGSGKGRHVYLYVDALPPTTRALDTPIGNVELRAEGTYVAAPPSVHPVTNERYVVDKPAAILRVPDLSELITWIESFKISEPPRQSWRPPRTAPPANGTINPDLITAIADSLRQRPHRERGEWINCACVYPERHKNGDSHASFGFNTTSGYGYCYRCGTILAKDLCERLDIQPRDHGGLMKPPPPPLAARSRSAGDIPTPPAEIPPPEKPLPPISEVPLPDWLSQYTGWASRIGSQTPVIFHQAAGIWLAATAIARRLAVDTPWGIQVFPNLYVMLIAETTYYRKTTAYMLAEQVVARAIPHMLMPTPGSPERFWDSLAGLAPLNYGELPSEDRELVTAGMKFAAQRGLFRDEVTGLFGSMRKDYMAGMKEDILKMYDCPEKDTKETQSGVRIIRRAAPSILGVTTPIALSTTVGPEDWGNGLLPRFALLTPEPDYAERPPVTQPEPLPTPLISGLRDLHHALPAPRQQGDAQWRIPDPLKVQVAVWEQVMAYASRLRKLCDPTLADPLDERLRGCYGRLHVQALKVAIICAALDWVQHDTTRTPVITPATWDTALAIAEHWRLSAHRLLAVNASLSADRELRDEERVLQYFTAAGWQGAALREAYRALKLSAKDCRQHVHNLVSAGLLERLEPVRPERYGLAGENAGGTGETQ